MSSPVRSLVLFDIDGTLVLTGRAGIRGMNAAFGRLHGRPDALEGVPVAGRTDRAIVTQAFKQMSVDPTSERVDALRSLYIERLAHEITQPGTGFVGVLPGVGSLLETLAGREDVCVGLLTGNFEAGARVKLGHFDLWSPFCLGAFGDDHINRRDLVPLALQKARHLGHDVGPDRVLVIGDTPLDVDCAHAHGARALAVATGEYDIDSLRATGADAVVPTLADVGATWIEEIVGRR